MTDSLRNGGSSTAPNRLVATGHTMTQHNWTDIDSFASRYVEPREVAICVSLQSMLAISRILAHQ